MEIGQLVFLENNVYSSLDDMVVPVLVEALVGDHLLVSYGLGNSLCEHIHLKGNRIIAASLEEFCIKYEVRLAKEIDKLNSEIKRSESIIDALKMHRKN